MNKSWISNLQTLIANLKKENLETDENLNLLLDFEQELFNLCKAITISSDKSIEKVYEDISLLSCHFIISRFLQKKHFNGTEKNLNETRNKIQKTFKSLNELEIISEDINDWYCSDKISPRENYNLEEYNFSSLLKGENPEKLEKYLLSFILIFSQNMPDFLQFSDDIINFLKMMVSASSEKELMEITNTTIIKYWSNYIELNGEYKTSMYERKAFLTKKISEMENSLSNFLIIQNSKTVFIDDLLEVYSYWLLFETDEESRNKISSAYKLLLRIFNNEYQITINKKGIEAPVPDFMFFIQSAALFMVDLQKYYGIAICLFLLLQYIPYEKFCLIFVEPKTPEQNQFDIARVLFTGTYIDTFAENARIVEPHNMDLRKRYAGYENELKEALQKSINDVQRREVIGQHMRTGSYKLLQSMMFFAVWNLCGSYQVDEYSISNPDEGINKKINIEKPFLDSIKDGSWYGTEKQKNIYNHVAKEFDFNKPTDRTEPFGKINYSEFVNKDAVMNLLYNLSRSRIYSKEALMNQMNYTRSQQSRLLYIKWNKNGGYDDYDKAIKIQNQLKNIDVGFNIHNYEQIVFPFNLPSFTGALRERLKFVRPVTCKFCCETDNVIDEKKKNINWRKTNEIGFSNRYLYKDRNIETHKGKHTSVESLLKTSNWETLLLALLDFQNEILFKKMDLENKSHDYIYNSPRNDSIFFIIDYLTNTVTMLISILRKKVCEASGIVFNQKNDFNSEEERIKFYEDFCNQIRNKIDIKKLTYEGEAKFDLRKEDTFKQEFLFKEYLEDMLNIMFSVNGSNEDGFDYNRNARDFYDQYYSQVAFYLFYLTLKFEILEKK